MKKILFLSCLCLCFNTQAADIYVNSSGQAGTYTTISSAITASSNGDRILISPYNSYEENLTIDKSLTISSSVSGNDYNLSGDIVVNAFPNMDLRLVGGMITGSLVANTGTATVSDMADLYVIESSCTGITCSDYVKAHLLFLDDVLSINIKHGNVIGCNIPSLDLTISDGPSTDIGDTIKIIGNSFKSLSWDNDDNYFYVSNNNFIHTIFRQNGYKD